VLNDALSDVYLLDRVRTHIAFGDAAYWFMVTTCVLVALGAIRAAASLLPPQHRGARRRRARFVVVAIIFLLMGRFLGNYANHAVQEVF
jgi:hypothetical protein